MAKILACKGIPTLKVKEREKDLINRQTLKHLKEGSR
jgi:hypothetical protein